MELSKSIISTSGKPFKCSEQGCTASFSRSSKLTVHVRKHTGERPFVCDEPACDKSYTNTAHLKRHKKTSHGGDSPDKFMCEYEGCGFVLANKYSLKKHIIRHHNPSKYQFTCQFCSEGFSKKRQLQQHVYAHTGEAPFSCDKCNISFVTMSKLNRHKISHGTHICDCGLVFDKWSSFVTHRRRCKRLQFECEVCKQIFHHLGNFKSHKLKHMDRTEKMVVVCPYLDCNRFYFEKKNLTFHINSFHRKSNTGDTFKCTFPKCNLILKTKRSLQVHLKKHFNWTLKKPSRVRCDKGKLKRTMASKLIGETCNVKSNTENFQIKNGKINNKEEVLTNLLQEQSDVKPLHEKIVNTIPS